MKERSRLRATAFEDRTVRKTINILEAIEKRPIEYFYHNIERIVRILGAPILFSPYSIYIFEFNMQSIR